MENPVPAGRRGAGRALRATLAALGVLAVLAGGCAPTVRGLGPARGEPRLALPDPALPAGVAPPQTPALSGTARARDLYALPLRAYLPAGKPRAVILALHGFNDYSNAFALPGPWFAGRGIALYAYDQRGFGATPDAGYWAGEDALVADLDAVVAALRRAHPDVPVTLLGESMGAAVVIAALSRPDPPPVAGAVLTAPAVWGWSELPPVPRVALAVAARVMPWNLLTPPRQLRVQASDNIAMLRALGRDPLVIKRTRVDAVAGLTDLMETAWREAGRVRVPTLLLYGARDQIIPPAPVARVGRAMAPVARAAVYPAGWHLLLRDLDAELVWRDIAAWTLDHEAPLPSGEERLPGTRLGRFADD